MLEMLKKIKYLNELKSFKHFLKEFLKLSETAYKWYTTFLNKLSKR